MLVTWITRTREKRNSGEQARISKFATLLFQQQANSRAAEVDSARCRPKRRGVEEGSWRVDPQRLKNFGK
jgi:hypothetical protein